MKKLNSSHVNHGTKKGIVSTVTEQHEIEFNPSDIIELLMSTCSDDLAKLINKLGEIYNKDQMSECYSVEDLDDQGKEFIESMYYFLTNKDI